MVVEILIGLAFLGANLPFINQRIVGCIPLPSRYAKKPFLIRLLELAALYFLVGTIAYFFESGIGNVFVQGWEFFAITICLFLVLAFPGFVFQYLRRS